LYVGALFRRDGVSDAPVAHRASSFRSLPSMGCPQLPNRFEGSGSSSSLPTPIICTVEKNQTLAKCNANATRHEHQSGPDHTHTLSFLPSRRTPHAARRTSGSKLGLLARAESGAAEEANQGSAQRFCHVRNPAGEAVWNGQQGKRGKYVDELACSSMLTHPLLCFLLSTGDIEIRFDVPTAPTPLLACQTIGANGGALALGFWNGNCLPYYGYCV